MKDAYNRVAAGDVPRIAALSDGGFAVPVTLLVLDIHAPERAEIHSEAALAALALYWANILPCGAALYLTWRLAAAKKLNRPDMEGATDRALRRRIEIAQALYFVGLLLGLVHILIGVGFIIAVQLNYAVAPFRPWRSGAGGERSGD